MCESHVIHVYWHCAETCLRMAVLWYGHCDQEYWLLYPVREAHCGCIIGQFGLFSAGYALITEIMACPFLPQWALDIMVTGFLGATEGRLHPAGQKPVNAVEAVTVPHWSETEARRTWAHWYFADLFQTCCWKPLMSWCFRTTWQGRPLSRTRTSRIAGFP